MWRSRCRVRVQGQGAGPGCRVRVQGEGVRMWRSGCRNAPALSEIRLPHLIRKVDVRLPAKRNSTSHGARPDHLIITMTKWIRTSRLSIKNSLSGVQGAGSEMRVFHPVQGRELLGFMVQGSGCRVQGAGCRVQDSGFRVQGSGFRVQG